MGCSSRAPSTGSATGLARASRGISELYYQYSAIHRAAQPWCSRTRPGCGRQPRPGRPRPATMGAMRYIVIGAGGVGGTIGGRLAQAGHEVVLVARGPHLDALRAQGGLRLATPEGTSVIGVPAVSGPDEVELCAGDVLLLATKTQDAEAALAGWAWKPVQGGTVAAEDLPVLCAQNGVASERLTLRRFRQVYGVCVWLPATHLEPGLVEAQGAPLSGLLHVGRYPSGTDGTIE